MKNCDLDASSNSSNQNRFRLFLFCFAIVAISFALNTTNNNFPIGYHFDEPKKIGFIIEGKQDFHHPVLMLEAIRIANLPFGFSKPEQVAILGRTTIAFLGSLICLTMFLITKDLLPTGWRLLTAAAVAIAPTIVVHSHYIKEDIPLTLFCLVTLLAMSQYFGKPNSNSAFLAGLAFGLSIASHYKGLLLILVIGTYICISVFKDLRLHLVNSLIFLATSAIVFLIVNNCIFDSPITFWRGFNHERTHAIVGHSVPIRWNDFYLCYHLVYSILPSMTWPTAVTSILAFIWFGLNFRTLAVIEKLLFIFAAYSYLVPELSPLKPHPDECRYILPMVPVLIYFGVKLFFQFHKRFEGSLGNKRLCRTAIWIVAIGTMVLVPMADSMFLCYHFNQDTRHSLEKYAENNGIVLEYEPMAGTEIRKEWGYQIDPNSLKEAGVTHFACSSFSYDVYFLAERLERQPVYVSERRRDYESLFAGTEKIFRPKYRSFSFTNPTIQLIKIGDKRE